LKPSLFNPRSPLSALPTTCLPKPYSKKKRDRTLKAFYLSI
jgi:hypothetical protein